jgi:integrase
MMRRNVASVRRQHPTATFDLCVRSSTSRRRRSRAGVGEGFLEAEQYEAVRRRLRPDLQVALTVYHVFGWRKDEMLTLERRHVDLDVETMRLDTSKNDEGRTVRVSEIWNAPPCHKTEAVYRR